MTSFSLFGIGDNGIPKLYQSILNQEGGAEKLIEIIISECRKLLRPGYHDSLPPGWLRASVQVLIEWYAGRGEPVPSGVLEANAYALSLISPDTSKPMIPGDLREQMGIPKGRGDLLQFMEAAGRESFGLFYAVAFRGPELAEILKRVEGGQWELSARTLHLSVGVSRATIASYREKPEYRRLIIECAGLMLLQRCLSGKRHRDLSHLDISRHVRRIPSGLALKVAGNALAPAQQVRVSVSV